MGAIGLITEMCIKSPDILAHFRKVFISNIFTHINLVSIFIIRFQKCKHMYVTRPYDHERNINVAIIMKY